MCPPRAIRRFLRRLVVESSMMRVHKTEYWNMGILEYCILNASFHYSIIPVFRSANL
jgi:hypothetical protein